MFVFLRDLLLINIKCINLCDMPKKIITIKPIYYSGNIIFTRIIWSIGDITKYCQQINVINCLEISRKFMNLQSIYSLSIIDFVFNQKYCVKSLL